ncbi:MAG: ribonuclease P protein component [Deltaproteobacteria bacterium]|nr:ribonuclease P protein component [Deltaproteobacteria bacterium]
MATRLGFPQDRRLRKRRQFLSVQSGGRRLGGKYFLFFIRAQDDSPISSVAGATRFGITVTRKIGNAVIRNRVKRLVREGCRHAAHLFPANLDLVVVARHNAAAAAASDVAADILGLARRLGPSVGSTRNAP